MANELDLHTGIAGKPRGRGIVHVGELSRCLGQRGDCNVLSGILFHLRSICDSRGTD
jgi:hypothetical protein